MISMEDIVHVTVDDIHVPFIYDVYIYYIHNACAIILCGLHLYIYTLYIIYIRIDLHTCTFMMYIYTCACMHVLCALYIHKWQRALYMYAV